MIRYLDFRPNLPALYLDQYLVHSIAAVLQRSTRQTVLLALLKF